MFRNREFFCVMDDAWWVLVTNCEEVSLDKLLVV